jgi:hypothetical protein
MPAGVMVVAYGKRARSAALDCADSLAEAEPERPLIVVSDEIFPIRHPAHACIVHERHDPGARWVKLSLDLLTPFTETVYLDADTTVHGSLAPLIDPLLDGWEMAMTISVNQGREALANLDDAERRDVLDPFPGDPPVVYQCGVFSWRSCPATSRLFGAWRTAWKRWGRHDQGAFLQALDDAPVSLWLLGRPFNGGAVVQHHFGRARP